MSWYDFDEKAVVECRCGWKGPAGAGGIETYGECFAYECPECGKTLAVFSYPTIDETKRRAEQGNEKALAELGSALRRESFMERATASELSDPAQLPDLAGETIEIEWDFEDREKAEGEDNFTVLRCRGKEIWREIAYYEGKDRYFEVARILREKYGARLRDLKPTGDSELYLFGDDLWASREIESFRQRLNDGF